MHKFADAVFGTYNSKIALYYIIKLGQIIHNKGIFLNLFRNLKSDLSLAPGPFLVCKGCFEIFTKSKKGSGTSFWCTFSAWFFHKNVLYILILYQWTQFQCHTFFLSQDIKQNVLLSSYLDTPTPCSYQAGWDANQN